MPTITPLYYLENAQFYILEIKRTDLSHDSDFAERFQWLIIEKENQQIQCLKFIAKDAAGEIQERFFEQGYLKFNDNTGTYIEKFNSGQHQLENKTGNSLPIELINILTNHLSI